ncbi:MAG TPA: aminodeoxychorismate synthase component I [Candidatus Thermoplasmatota archaeon]|nr:aminodeoxychorismate synthase component I [Candidatus Thermoplasmatota archaeon]
MVAAPIPWQEPWTAFRRLYRPGEGALFLDSNPAHSLPHLARHSYAGVAPTGRFTAHRGEDTSALRDLADVLHPEGAPDPRAPPFQGGWAGIVSYDAGRLIEEIPSVARDDTRLPLIDLFRFDAVVAWDHAARASWILVRPDAPPAAQQVLLQRLKGPPAAAEDPGLAPGVKPYMTRERFEQMVQEGKNHVRAGDVFQVNLSHRLEAAAPRDPLALYGRLRAANPAPFAAFFDAVDYQVLSSSPERLFTLRGRTLSARPIAGTRRRSPDPEEDAALKAELAADEKERAEHVMLVDLARNDIGRVAEYGSVRVDELLTVETYRAVHHLVSNVEGTLRDGFGPVDALRALFPGGTITGAPKVESMRIIERLEPVRRGPYTGSIGWFSATGDVDLNILIRTLLVKDGATHLQVGAGIVEDSVPAKEYEETLAKAKALLAALGAEAP